MSAAGWVFMNLDTGTVDGLAESAYALDLDVLDADQRALLGSCEVFGSFDPAAIALVEAVGVPLLPLVVGSGAAVDGVSCPVCGSADVSGGFVEVLDDTAWQSVSCDDCGSHWSDVFALVARENVVRGSRVDIATARPETPADVRRALTDWVDMAYEDANGCGVEL